MPRPKPRTGASSWTAPRLQLSKDAWAELVRCLGYTKNADKVPVTFADTINDVERWLGFYPGAVEATMTAPRAGVVRGRPRKEPLMTLIGKLRYVFARDYVGGESKRQPKRGSLPLSGKEKSERLFVEIALDAAGIRCVEDVRRHFDQPSAALPSERMRVMKRISGEVIKKPRVRTMTWRKRKR